MQNLEAVEETWDSRDFDSGVHGIGVYILC